MEDLDKRRAEIMRKAQEQIAEAEAEHAIREALGPLAVHLNRIYIGRPLYGIGPRLSFGNIYHANVSDRPSAATILEIAEAFPGVPVAWWLDSCRSMRTRAYIEADTNPKRGEPKSVDPVAPAWVEWDENLASLRWAAEVGPHTCRITCALRHDDADRVGRTSAERVEYRGGYRYKDRRLHVADGAYNIYTPEGESLAGATRPVSWWSPDTSTGKHTLCWEEYGEEGCTVAQIVRSLFGLQDADR